MERPVHLPIVGGGGVSEMVGQLGSLYFTRVLR